MHWLALGSNGSVFVLTAIDIHRGYLIVCAGDCVEQRFALYLRRSTLTYI